LTQKFGYELALPLKDRNIRQGVEPLRNLLTQKKDYYAGGLMTLIGVGAVLEARHYNIGTLFHMGPGFFPIILGVVMTCLGILIAGVAAMATAVDDDQLIIPKPEWRAWACILAGPILFIILGNLGGLIPATFACVFVSAIGDRDSTWMSAFILAVGVTACGVLLFSYLLQVSLPMWRWGTL
jgi:putative tricarboxylic transport membrane protein